MLLIFWNFILRLKHLKKHFTKILTLRNLWTNAYQNLSMMCLCKKPAVIMALKFELWIVLPYLGNTTSPIKTRITKCIGNLLKFGKLTFKKKNYFKEDIRRITSGLKIVFLKLCNPMLFINWNVKTGNIPITVKSTRILKPRFQNTRAFLRERVSYAIKDRLFMSVRDQMLNGAHLVAWGDFPIIGREANHHVLETKESLYIKQNYTSLKRNK